MSVSALNRFFVITRPLLVLAQCQPEVVALPIVADLCSPPSDSTVQIWVWAKQVGTLRQDLLRMGILLGNPDYRLTIDRCTSQRLFAVSCEINEGQSIGPKDRSQPTSCISPDATAVLFSSGFDSKSSSPKPVKPSIIIKRGLLLGFNTFRSARITRQGIELMHMIKKGQMISANGQAPSTAAQCYALAC